MTLLKLSFKQIYCEVAENWAFLNWFYRLLGLLAPFVPQIFVRSGELSPSAGKLLNLGLNGFARSSTAGVYNTTDGNIQARFLMFNAKASQPSSDPRSRYLGFPLRCLAD